MAKQSLLSCAYLVGSANLTSQSNKLSVESMVAEVDVTTFGSGGAKEVIGGIETVSISGGGPWEAGGTGYVDDLIEGDKRLILPHTWGPSNSGAAVAAPAYVVKALRTDAKFFGNVGDLMTWEISASGSAQLARGAFLQAPTQTISADGNGTAVQVGAVASGKTLWGNLHVLSATGTSPTLAVKVQSDDNSDFSSATDRLTFQTATSDPATWYDTQSLDGPITDDYWRVALDISGSGSPTFVAVVAIGINLF